MFKLSFNPFKSKSIWGMLIVLFGYLNQTEVLAALPSKWAAAVTAIGALLAALGIRDAAAGTTASTVTTSEETTPAERNS